MTTTSTHETEIIVDPDVPLVRIIREFDAPPEKVFRAHTDPELLVQWLGPRDLEMRVDHFDCRTGGSYRYVHARDGEEYGFHGCFHEVRPASSSCRPSPSRACPTASRSRGSCFEDLGDGRTRLDRDLAGRLASRAATPSSPAAWRPASARATSASTSCSPAERERRAGYPARRPRPCQPSCAGSARTVATEAPAAAR